jgi:hypothetical protein
MEMTKTPLDLSKRKTKMQGYLSNYNVNKIKKKNKITPCPQVVFFVFKR